MSGCGTTRPFANVRSMSAIEGNPDIQQTARRAEIDLLTKSPPPDTMVVIRGENPRLTSKGRFR
jgi:hypothetical protein